MNISISYRNIYTMIVKAAGQINLETAAVYGTTVKDAILDYDEDIKELILDFSEITYISSIGLRVILELYRELDEKDGILKITGASEEVMKTFQMIGFNKFIIFE